MVKLVCRLLLCGLLAVFSGFLTISLLEHRRIKMTTKKKTTTVTKRVTEEDKLNSVRWNAFIKASGTPVQELTDEWLSFFDSQADIETASSELVRLIDLAIKKDIELENGK
jgi:hypothetical protein